MWNICTIWDLDVFFHINFLEQTFSGEILTISWWHIYWPCIFGFWCVVDYVIVQQIFTLNPNSCPCMPSWRCVLSCSVMLALAIQLTLPNGIVAGVTEAETGINIWIEKWKSQELDSWEQCSCTGGLALNVLLQWEGDAKASQLIWRGWQKHEEQILTQSVAWNQG